ncbi:unnamed protein product [Rotaria sordida]|uniref:Uncharacterized protein n=1 Tax=Rotaria sordida TaxID=392033 RepID=A0A815Q8H9_9BILA|nr:unnamed protein product [Rotaria sordida]CAF4120598.1 unnamed protein product [Rotaria sordida]
MASSSQMCSIETCKRSAHALCYCCQKSVCIEHLNEHSHRLNDQLLPLADDINDLFDRFNNVLLPQSAFCIELDNWREEAHQTIDHHCERKKQEFDKLIMNERQKQKIDLDHLRYQIDESIKKQETTTEYVDSMNNSLRCLQRQINELEIPPVLSPLDIDEHIVDIYQNILKPKNILPLPPPYRSIKIQYSSFIAASENHILLENIHKFYLLDQQLGIQNEFPWNHDIPWHMVWSKTLNLFFIITSKEIFTLDEKKMMIEPCSILHNSSMADWSSGTCSNDSLYLIVDAMGTSIYEYNLRRSIEFVKEYRTPFTCSYDELISDIAWNNQTLALVIANRSNQWRVDLCSSTTLGRYWSIQLGVLINEKVFRCCLLNNGQLLMLNGDTSELIHISADGKIIKKDNYHVPPLHAVQLTDEVIVIVNETSVDLYRLS